MKVKLLQYPKTSMEPCKPYVKLGKQKLTQAEEEVLAIAEWGVLI